MKAEIQSHAEAQRESNSRLNFTTLSRHKKREELRALPNGPAPSPCGRGWGEGLRAHKTSTELEASTKSACKSPTQAHVILRLQYIPSSNFTTPSRHGKREELRALPKLGLVFLLCLFGCAKAPKTVWVDVDSEVQQEIPVVQAQVKTPTPPKPHPGITATIPAKPALEIKDPSNSGELNVVESIETAQRRAARLLASRLTAYYDREATRLAAIERKKLGDPYRKEFDRVAAQLRAVFDDYASQRSPQVVRLANLVGWPDPNPKREVVETTARTTTSRTREEARAIRVTLTGIDKTYDQKVQAILDEAQRRAQFQQVDLLQRISDFAQKQRQRAKEEADAEVSARPEDLGLRLDTPQPLRLPATSAKVMTIPGEGALPAAPKVHSEEVLGTTAQRRMLIDHQLRIWLALKRYQLADKPNGVPDLTREFHQWKTEHLAGP